MNKRRLIAILLVILLWQIGASLVNSEVLLPMPQAVLTRMLSDIITPSFYYTVAVTLLRMLKGLVIALACALVLGLIGGLRPHFSDYLSVLNDIIKTIPTISYIIIAIIWLGSEGSVTVIAFFILFPVLYANVLLGMNSIPSDLKDVMTVYPETLFHRITKVYLPMLVPYLLSGLKVAFGLGFKVSVMAEVLAQVRVGIGKQIYYSRNILDMTGIFSWTIWIIILSLAVDHVFEIIIRKRQN